MKQIDTEALIFFLDNSTTISNIRHYLTDNDRKKTQSKLKQNARLRDGRLYGNLKCMTRSPQQESFVFYQIISQKMFQMKTFSQVIVHTHSVHQVLLRASMTSQFWAIEFLS